MKLKCCCFDLQVSRGRQDTLGDKCTICREKVYLLERHIDSGKLYHRACHRKSEFSPTSKVFKRQPFSSEEEKKDLISNKQRKIDTNTNASTPKRTEPQLDFWQRRNQDRLKEKEKEEKVAMDVQSGSSYTSGLKTKTELPPSKLAEDKSKKGPVKVPSLFDAESKDKKSEPKPRGVNYADKFKELNERNLKQLNDDDTSDKKGKSDESSVFHPKAKPRQKMGSKFEKMDTSEKTLETSDPKPVSRFSKATDNHSPRAAVRNIDNKPEPPKSVQTSGFSRPKTPTQTNKTEFKLNLRSTSPASTISDKSPSSPPPLPSSMPPKLPLSPPPKTHVSTVSKQERNITSPKSSPRNSTPVTLHTKDKNNIKSPKAATRKLDNVSQGALSGKPGLSGPAKPPRTSVLIEDHSRSQSPMDTGELHEPAKAVVKGPSGGHTVVITAPNRGTDENKDMKVFGGLLKSLAHVRTKHDNENTNNADNDKGAKESNISDRNAGLNKNIGEPKIKPMTKVSQDDNSGRNFSRVQLRKIEEKDEPPVKVPERPKTSYVPDRPKSSFVSQNKFMETEKSDMKSHVNVKKTTKTITTTTIISTNEGKKTEKTKNVVKEAKYEEDDLPEWKRKLEERKNAKARPKSADLLTEKETSNGGSMLDWQKEAAKRKEARKGGYVDPEKPKIKPISAITPGVNVKDKSVTNQNKDNSDRFTPSHKPARPETTPSKVVPPKTDINFNNSGSNVQSPERKRITFNGSVFDNDDKETEQEKQKKKISVDFRFKFEDIELKPGPKKPPRPGAPPKGIENAPISPRLHPSRSPVTPVSVYSICLTALPLYKCSLKNTLLVFTRRN